MTAHLVVIDACALAEFVIGTERGESVAVAIRDAELHAPYLVITEVTSTLRGWVLGGHLDESRARAATVDLVDLPLKLWDPRPLTGLVWHYRHNLSAYDATYVALAQALNCTLISTDERLAKAVRNVTVEVPLQRGETES